MAVKSVDFTKLMDVIASHLHQRAIPVFPYLDDWLIRDLIPNRLISHTKYCLQTVQSLKVRFDTSPEIHVYKDGISDTTEYSLGTTEPSRFPTSDYRTVSFSSSNYGTNFLSLSGKLGAAAEFILLGRLHLRPL